MIDPREVDELDVLIILMCCVLLTLIFAGCSTTRRIGNGPDVKIWTVRDSAGLLELRRFVAGEGSTTLSAEASDGYRCMSQDDLAKVLRAIAGL